MYPSTYPTISILLYSILSLGAPPSSPGSTYHNARQPNYLQGVQDVLKDYLTQRGSIQPKQELLQNKQVLNMKSTKSLQRRTLEGDDLPEILQNASPKQVGEFRKLVDACKYVRGKQWEERGGITMDELPDVIKAMVDKDLHKICVEWATVVWRHNTDGEDGTILEPDNTRDSLKNDENTSSFQLLGLGNLLHTLRHGGLKQFFKGYPSTSSSDTPKKNPSLKPNGVFGRQPMLRMLP